MLKGGHNKFLGSVYAEARSFSYTDGGGGEIPTFKRGGARSFALSWGGVQKVPDPQIFHFVAPPLPTINDQSLRSKCSYVPHYSIIIEMERITTIY